MNEKAPIPLRRRDSSGKRGEGGGGGEKMRPPYLPSLNMKRGMGKGGKRKRKVRLGLSST